MPVATGQAQAANTYGLASNHMARFCRHMAGLGVGRVGQPQCQWAPALGLAGWLPSDLVV